MPVPSTVIENLFFELWQLFCRLRNYGNAWETGAHGSRYECRRKIDPPIPFPINEVDDFRFFGRQHCNHRIDGGYCPYLSPHHTAAFATFRPPPPRSLCPVLPTCSVLPYGCLTKILNGYSASSHPFVLSSFSRMNFAFLNQLLFGLAHEHRVQVAIVCVGE